MIGVCAKDLICSQAKYHALCYKRFVRIQCACDTGRVVMIMNCSQHMMQSIVFCEDLILNPRVIEFTEIRTTEVRND